MCLLRAPSALGRNNLSALTEAGLTPPEIAARLGVAESHVLACLVAYGLSLPPSLPRSASTGSPGAARNSLMLDRVS